MILVPDIIRECVAKVSTKLTAQLQAVQPIITGVHCLIGSVDEIKAKLAGLSTTLEGTYDKYPAVVLFQDYPIDHDGGDFAGEATLQMIIAYHTAKTDYTEDRYDKVFKPILYPIYYALLYELWKHPNINAQHWTEIKHRQIDRPHWGNPAKYGNDGYILNDVLDVVEMLNTRLTLQEQTNCP